MQDVGDGGRMCRQALVILSHGFLALEFHELELLLRFESLLTLLQALLHARFATVRDHHVENLAVLHQTFTVHVFGMNLAYSQ